MAKLPTEPQQQILDQLAEVISEQRDLGAKRQRLFERAYSEEYSCTLKQLADAAGLSIPMVHYLLNGDQRKKQDA